MDAAGSSHMGGVIGSPPHVGGLQLMTGAAPPDAAAAGAPAAIHLPGSPGVVGTPLATVDPVGTPWLALLPARHDQAQAQVGCHNRCKS